MSIPRVFQKDHFVISWNVSADAHIDIRKYLENAKKPCLVLSSWGGDAGASFATIDAIQRCGKAVTGIAWSTCESGALMLLLACTKRYATPRTTFLIHRAKSSEPTWWKRRRYRAKHQLVNDWMQEMLNPYGILLSARQDYFDEHEALRRGIIHGIM